MKSKHPGPPPPPVPKPGVGRRLTGRCNRFFDRQLDRVTDWLGPRLPKKLTRWYRRHTSARIGQRVPTLVISVTAVLLLLVGGVSTATLGHVLTVRIDDQLQAALLRAKLSALNNDDPINFLDSGDGKTTFQSNSLRVPATGSAVASLPVTKLNKESDRGDEPFPTGPRSLQKAGSLAGMIQVVSLPNGQIMAGQLTPDFQVRSLTSTQVETLVNNTTFHPSTVSLPKMGRFRAIALKTTQATITVALPLESRDRLLFDYCCSLLFYSVTGLFLVWIWAGWRTRRWLRPLIEVSHTARAVSKYDLASSALVPDRVQKQITDCDSEAGEVGCALNVALDNIENALQARAKTESSLQQFVADASHELRTPLATIRGYAQLLERSNQSDPAMAQAVQRILSEATRMTELVNHLLLLARLQAGNAIEKTAVPVADLLVEAVADGAIRSRDHQLDLQLDDHAADLMTLGDADKLRQVFTNLISNACQHTPAGTLVTVTLGTVSMPSEDPATASMIKVEVIDNGPGIAPAVLDTLFERFTRADSARSRSESAGLGLAITQQIVVAHGGKIEVASDSGGAKFMVLLPALQS